MELPFNSLSVFWYWSADFLTAPLSSLTFNPPQQSALLKRSKSGTKTRLDPFKVHFKAAWMLRLIAPGQSILLAGGPSWLNPTAPHAADVLIWTEAPTGRCEGGRKMWPQRPDWAATRLLSLANTFGCDSCTHTVRSRQKTSRLTDLFLFYNGLRIFRSGI